MIFACSFDFCLKIKKKMATALYYRSVYGAWSIGSKKGFVLAESEEEAYKKVSRGFRNWAMQYDLCSYLRQTEIHSGYVHIVPLKVRGFSEEEMQEWKESFKL